MRQVWVRSGMLAVLACLPSRPSTGTRSAWVVAVVRVGMASLVSRTRFAKVFVRSSPLLMLVWRVRRGSVTGQARMYAPGCPCRGCFGSAAS